MFHRLKFLVVISVVVLASAAVAGGLAGPPKSTAPVPIPIGDPGIVDMGAPNACLVAYDALLPTGTFLFPCKAASLFGPGPVIEYADDLHMTMSGALCEFSFTYRDNANSVLDIVITIYQNDAVDGILGGVLAGPYLIPGLPGGTNQVTFTPPDSPLLPVDVWFSITGGGNTNTLDHGFVLAPAPATTGISHDIALEVVNPGLFFFGGPPKVADFNIQVKVDATVPTEEATWGRIKALYETE